MTIDVQRGSVAALAVLVALWCDIAPGEQDASVVSYKAQVAVAPVAAETLDAYLAACVKQQHFSGAALVAREGKIVLSKGYGLADRENDVPCTPQTKFRLGSITKQFTAMAIMILQERGKLSVCDKIGKYVPNSPATWEEITIHHLLCHSSGIPNNTEVNPRYAHLVAQSTRPDELVAAFSDKPLLFRPGEKGRYSNSNYILLVDGTIFDIYVPNHYLDWPIGERAPRLTLVISRDGGRLFGAIEGKHPVELLAESQTRFRCRGAPQRVTFVRDKQGKVTHLELGTNTDGFQAEKINTHGS